MYSLSRDGCKINGRYTVVPENRQNARLDHIRSQWSGSKQDFDFLQDIWRNFFITIIFPEVKEFELCRRGEKTFDDGLHLKDGVMIKMRTGEVADDGMEVAH